MDADICFRKHKDTFAFSITLSLRWRHNDHAGVSNHQPHGCLLNRLFRRNSKKTSKLRVTGLCAGNSPGTGEFPAQMASYAENVSIWWRHHDTLRFYRLLNSLLMEENDCSSFIVNKIAAADDLDKSHDDVIKWKHFHVVGRVPVTGEFPVQRPLTRRFDIFFDVCPKKTAE